jgi:hypothetical protein
MEEELQSSLASSGAPREVIPQVFWKNANDAPSVTVCLEERTSSMIRAYSQGIDGNIIFQPENFSTELEHPKFRSSVRRISVPSQTAEVSS